MGVFFFPFSVFAINTEIEGYAVGNTQIVEINVHSQCYLVSSLSSVTYFVPTKSVTEWTNFIANKPSDINLDPCSATVCLYDGPGSTSALGDFFIEEYTDECHQTDEFGNCDDTQDDVFAKWDGNIIINELGNWTGPVTVDDYVYTRGELTFEENLPNSTDPSVNDESTYYAICRAPTTVECRYDSNNYYEEVDEFCTDTGHEGECAEDTSYQNAEWDDIQVLDEGEDVVPPSLSGYRFFSGALISTDDDSYEEIGTDDNGGNLGLQTHGSITKNYEICREEI